MRRHRKRKPYRARMWAIKGDGIGLIAGTLGYTRAASYHLIAGKRYWSPKECHQNGYRAVRIEVREIKRRSKRHDR